MSTIVDTVDSSKLYGQYSNAVLQGMHKVLHALNGMAFPHCVWIGRVESCMWQ